MNGAESGGINESQLAEVEHDERAWGANQLLGKPFLARCVELPAKGNDATTVECVGRNAQEIRRHVPAPLAIAVDVATISGMAVKQLCFSRESAEPVRPRLSPVPGCHNGPSLCAVRSSRISIYRAPSIIEKSFLVNHPIG
jgi:hypothetical protein